MAGAGGIRAGRAYVELYAENNKLVRGLRQAEAKLKAFGAKVTQVGKKMLMAAGAAAVPMAYASKTFAGFEDQMKAVQAVTGATTEKFKRLNDQAKELGRTTSFTAAEVGAGQLNLARAGFKPAEINAAIPSVLNLARATGTDLAEAAEIASGTLRAFELDATDMVRVNDVLTATANNSATTLTDLGETMKYVAPFAAEYGMTLEGTAKAAGVLANMQIKGSMAGTGMRKALMVMSDPAIRAKLQAMGVDLSNFGDSMVGLGKIMQTMTGPERIAMATEMFGARAAGAVVKLAKSDFPALSAAIDNAAGTAEESAKVMDSGLGGAFRRLMSAVEGVQIAIGEALAGALGKVMDQVAKVSGLITKLISENKKWVINFALTVAAVGGLGAALVTFGLVAQGLAFAIGGIATIASTVAGAVGLIGAALAALLSPIGLASAAVIGLGGYLLKTSGEGGKAIQALSDWFGRLKDDALRAFGGIADAMKAGDIQLAAQILWTTVLIEWTKGINAIYEVWTGFKQKFMEGWTNLSAKIATLFVFDAQTLATLEEDRARANQQRADRYGAQLAERARKLQTLKRKLDESLSGARAKREMTDYKSDLLKKIKKGTEGEGGVAAIGGKVAGTFSAAAAARLGMGGGAQERMANGIEDIKETNKQVARNTHRLLMQWSD